MVGKILPKKLAKGLDFCAVSTFFYIVRSDLNCFMRSTNLSAGKHMSIYDLDPCCSYGDHYLAHKDSLFYIIKGNSYRRVRNMNTDEGAVVYTLHPNCQGGDHYLSAYNYFYIIYLSRGVYRRTKNLHKDLDSEEFPLHPDCRKGLYYFGTNEHYYFVKPDDGWIEYIRSTNIDKNENPETFSFHPDILNFLPGGFGITKGPAYGKWVRIKTICNITQTPVEWKEWITKNVGYERNTICKSEDHWYVYLEHIDCVTPLLLQSHFSMTAEYGGFSVNTERENWEEATTVEEIIATSLRPNQKVYVWSYQLGLGKNPVLYCRAMRILPTLDPPTDVPLPHTKN